MLLRPCCIPDAVRAQYNIVVCRTFVLPVAYNVLRLRMQAGLKQEAQQPLLFLNAAVMSSTPHPQHSWPILLSQVYPEAVAEEGAVVLTTTVISRRMMTVIVWCLRWLMVKPPPQYVFTVNSQDTGQGTVPTGRLG